MPVGFTLPASRVEALYAPEVFRRNAQPAVDHCHPLNFLL